MLSIQQAALHQPLMGRELGLRKLMTAYLLSHHAISNGGIRAFEVFRIHFALKRETSNIKKRFVRGLLGTKLRDRRLAKARPHKIGKSQFTALTNSI